MTDNVNNSHEIDNLPNEANQRGENTEQRVVQAMDKYSKLPMAIVFNRGERSLVQKELVAELAQGFEYRRKAVEMALETRLHSIREACNHVLVTGKTHLRQQRLEYFGEVLKQVEKRMSDLADDYLQETDQRFEHLENYKSEAIRQRERIRLEKSVDNFLTTLDHLMDEFTQIIHEHIDHNGRHA